MLGNRLKVVLDTNVVFEGLTKRGGACGLVIDAWFADQIHVHVTDALTYEYMDVLSRKLTVERWERTRVALVTLLAQAEMTTVYLSWRPMSPDAGDDLVIDCAMNANATVITANLRDFRLAQQRLGLRVLAPLDFLKQLAEQE
jgi:putative PIN family toxin of toxin-antitoxin system